MIKVLDSFIADKIAAGEVIERPVSIVKELLENSVDAGATSIIVEIRNGGKSYIRVTDNGCGIPRDEVETAFLRHATSKIAKMTDLESIETLGFRGEALASIATVSRLTVVTRPKDIPAGCKVSLQGGRVVSNDVVGTNQGTTMEVEDVFYNTPARRKFMGSDAREASAIIELIEHYAIYYAGIRFLLINNGKTIFTTSGDGNTLSAIQSVYPTREYKNLIHVEHNMVNGYISDPGTTKSTRRGQLFFVNGRLVDSEVIQKGLEKGYGGRIFSGYPIAILFISVDPSTVDVNIHPGKRKIKFLHQDDIVAGISEAIAEAMTTRDAVPQGITAGRKVVTDSSETDAAETAAVSTDSKVVDIQSGAKQEAVRSSLAEGRSVYSDSKPAEKSPKSEQADIRSFLANLERKDSNTDKGAEAERPAGKLPDISIKEPTVRPFLFKDLQVCGYVFNTYIVLQARDDMYILDQHAAHERIFYEKLVGKYMDEGNLPQPILTPIVITVTANIYGGDREWMESLVRIGYDISDFGANTFIIRGIPLFMNLGEAERFAREYIESENADMSSSTAIEKLITKSCKSAVKANDKLSAAEISELVKDLAKCRQPYCCPHGRPTFIRLTKSDIEKSFRRK